MVFFNDPSIVYVVDDEQPVRDSLAELLRSVGLTAQTHASAESFLTDFDPSVPGCVMLDVCLPGMSGLTLLEHFATQTRRIPAIVLTGHADVPMAVQAMSQGAFGFLEKPFRTHELLELVKKAIEQDQRSLRQDAQRHEVRIRFQRLSPREMQVLELVTGGAANKQIAKDLGISDRTVEAHRARIMNKLGVDSVVELVALAVTYRSITDPQSVPR